MWLAADGLSTVLVKAFHSYRMFLYLSLSDTERLFDNITLSQNDSILFAFV